MRFDTSLLRSTLGPNAIGFERFAQLMDEAARQPLTAGFPAYNLEQVDADHYRLTLAVAGFTRDEISLETLAGELTITGKKAEAAAGVQTLLHRGIAQRSFKRRFHLDDHVEVTGASLADGLLVIDLKRELPEAAKPRSIAIN